MEIAPMAEHFPETSRLSSSSDVGAMTLPNQNLIGPQVRRLRMEAGFSQEAFAAKLQVAGWDVSRAGLSKIESRLRRVNDAELYLLAKVLGCELAGLFPDRPVGIKDVLRQGRE
jgi:transcriptional regulator with XRE-family HTH domain